jgi:hypothetical protein
MGIEACLPVWGAEIVDVVRHLIQTRNIEIDRPAAEVGLQMLARGGDFADGSSGTMPIAPNATGWSPSTKTSRAGVL